MNAYDVEIVHEDSGSSIKFQYESDISYEDDLASQILSDISITVFKIVEQ